MPTYQEQRSQTESSSDSSSSSDSELEEHALVGNQAIVDIIQAENQATGERELNPHKNGIVYMGFNHFSHDEANALNRYNSDAGGSKSVRPQKEQDHLTKEGVKYDLRTVEGAASFVATLGLPDQMAVDAADFLLNAQDQARDELGLFIQILSEAEMGERKIDRMVLSGHSVGSMIWGDDNGTVNMKEFEDLSHIFPKAFEQVQHVLLSACYSGGETRMNSHREIWRGAESIFAYHDSSPGTWTGAMGHMKEWESRTEAGMDPAGIDPEIARGHRKAKNVSTWNVTDGYQGGRPMSLYEIESALRAQAPLFEDYFHGNQLVENSQSGPLRDYYGLVQRGISHVEVDETTRADLEVKRDQTIRLLYYGLVCTKFQGHYSQSLESAYQQAGMSVPDFSTMNRKEILDHIASMEAQISGTEGLRLLQSGLRDLDPDVIPTSWV